MAHRIIQFLIPHSIATAISGVVFVAVPTVVVLAIMFVDNDPGGPMFFPIFLMLTVLSAIAVCFVSFALSICLQVLQRHYRFPSWVPVVISLPLACIIVAFIGFIPDDSATFWLFWIAVVSGTFCVYWVSLLVSQKLLGHIVLLSKK